MVGQIVARGDTDDSIIFKNVFEYLDENEFEK